MNERIDPELTKAWEKRLTEEGLPSDAKVEKKEGIPIDIATDFMREVENTRGLKLVLRFYRSLKRSLRIEILVDIQEKRNEGYSLRQMKRRFATLVGQAIRLTRLADTEKVKMEMEMEMRMKKTILVQKKQCIEFF